MARKPDPKNDYVNRIELRQEIEKSFDQDELTHRAWEMIILMANRVSRKFSYKYEEDRQDCIMEALEVVHKYWRNYDKEKSNYPFSYFTQIIKNGLAKGLRTIRPKSLTTLVNMSNDQMSNLG
jgi:hypothetical protein